MKYKLRNGLGGAALLLLLAVSIVYRTQAYTHPCILLNNADLTALNANKNTAPWSTGYALFTNAGEAHTKLSYTMQGPFVEVGRNPNVNLNQWRNDMQAIFGLALQWKFTGDAAYAQKARDILIAWATTHTTWSGVEPYLEMGDYAHYFCMGASILRSWSGWTASDTTTVKNYFNNVNWPATRTDIPLRSANQGAAHIIGGMCHAVYLDDVAKFDQAVQAFRANGCAGLRTTQANGQIGDSGRDQAHAHGELWHYAKIGELAWKAAGVDLFGLEGNRIRTCGEYWAQFNNGGSVPWVTAGTCYNVFPAVDFEGIGPRSLVPEAQHILHGAYVVRKGLSMSQTETYINNNGDNWRSWVFRKTSDSSIASAPAVITFPSATPVTSLSNADIGSPSPAGSGAYNNGTWTITGGGADYWGGAANDQFHFTYKPWTGDGAIIARVASIQNTNVNAKAGVMIRESLSANGKMAYMSIRPGGYEVSARGYNAVSHYARDHTDSDTLAPYWVKLERRGTRISCFTSPNGTDWTPARVYDFTLASTCYFGLALTSHVNGTLNTATFTNVSITGGPIVDGTYRLCNRASGKYLDNLGSTANGAAVAQWESSTSNNQRWQITTIGGYRKLICVTGNKRLDSLVNSTDGSIVGQWDDSTSNNQQWTIQDLSNGYYKVVNRANSKCLDTGGDNANGASMEFWGSGGSLNQQWQFVTVP